MTQENIFWQFQTYLKFGLGAANMSVSTDGRYIYFFEGTPMQPKHICTYKFDEDIITDIKSLDQSLIDSADYIKHNYIRPAWWGKKIC